MDININIGEDEINAGGLNIPLIKGDKGEKGDTGEQGIQGIQGEKGETGVSNVLTIGTVQKGEEASASITGDSPNQVLNLVLPKGDKGDTGEQGPKGDTGETGPRGEQGIQGVKGDKGDKGDTGETGATGQAGYTPIKGVDYWTEEDKQEIVEEVEEEINPTIETLETQVSELEEQVSDLESNQLTSEPELSTSYYLTDSADSRFRKFIPIGRTTQESDPTPENPVPIKNTGDNGSVNEKVQNKNLCNEESLKNVTVSGDDIVVATNGATIIEGIFEENTQYAIQAQTKQSTSGTYVRARIVYTDGTGDDILLNSSTDYALKSSVSALNKTINKITSYGGNNFTFKKGTLQIEQGSTATPYQAHSEQNISFPLSEGQKLMEGDYLADDGVHHKMKEIDLKDLTWTLRNTNSETGVSTYSAPLLDRKYEENLYVKCSHFTYFGTYSSPEYVYSLKEGLRFFYSPTSTSSTKSVYLNVKISTLSELQTWLSEENVKLQYPLAEETTEDFTEEQQTAWEEIKKARTYKNVTHISSEDETPANVDIVYVRDLETVINNLS